MGDRALAVRFADVATHDLVEAVGHRLGVPAVGTAKLELTYNDGEWVGSSYTEKVKPFAQNCRCRRHAWSPDCPVHPAQPFT